MPCPTPASALPPVLSLPSFYKNKCTWHADIETGTYLEIPIKQEYQELPVDLFLPLPPSSLLVIGYSRSSNSVYCRYSSFWQSDIFILYLSFENQKMPFLILIICSKLWQRIYIAMRYFPWKHLVVIWISG